MKEKWFFRTFVVVIILLGVCLQQFSVHNQEILLQFTNTKVSVSETENTVAVVKKQLQDIGVDNIKVYKEANGKLKITYYSKVDVASIKKLFSKKKDLSLGFNSVFPKEEPLKSPLGKNSNNFKIDVFEIQESNTTDFDFNGLALNLNPESDHFFTHKVHFYKNKIYVKGENKIEKATFISYRNNSVIIKYIPYHIPEVRAGPNSYLNS